jgi:flagellar motor protein MotB
MKTKATPACLVPKRFPIPAFTAKYGRVAFIDRSTRVGRSQGASIFWGVVSVCFAAAACFYFLKNHDNERSADQMRDQVLELREENESLTSQKDNLQASKTEAESQLKTREDLVEQKETELAAEEARLDGLGQQSASQTEQNQAQATGIRKFNDLIRKLGKDTPTDVVERGGRPVLRVPNARLFAAGDATLTPEGKTLLSQVAQALSNQLDTFELRVVSYTDANAEAPAPGDPKKDATAKPAVPLYATSWDLTAARAASISRFYRDQSTLPFLNVLVIGRGEAEPIASNAGENHARNRRVEITITPLPVAFHAPEPTDKEKAEATIAATPASDASQTDTPAPAKKKVKDKSEKPKTTEQETSTK